MNFSKSTILLLLILLSMTFAACSNIEETEGIGQTNFSSEIYNLSVTYKGRVYKVPCTNDSVGNVVYLDPEFKSIYDKELANDSNMATLYLGEDSIAYFQNVNTMLSSLNYGIDPDFPVLFNQYLEKLSKLKVGKLTFWDDKNYKDRSYTVEITGTTLFSCPNLKKSYNMNDKISSMKLWSSIPKGGVVYTMDLSNPQGYSKYQWSDLRVVFLGYKDSNFKHSVLCVVLGSGEYKEFPNLKHIGWGDKISSIQFRIGKKEDYKSNY